jgi:RNA polymerase sigma-70 factor, ECF subfamily
VTDSRRLLDSANAGDHLDRLYRAAWGLCGNREEAEDLVQETYARVLSRPRILRRSDDLGYLLRSLHNTFILNLRKEKRRVQGDGVSPESEPIDLRGHRRPESEAEAREIYETIASLPEDFRLAIVAVDVIGLSYLEAAKCLKVPPGTVRSRLFRARDKVANTLAGEPENPTGLSAAGC